jgi:hypothetical protein
VWQGVYVLRVNGSGLTLIGRVSQYPAGEGYGDSPDGGLQIERSVITGELSPYRIPERGHGNGPFVAHIVDHNRSALRLLLVG